MLQLILSPKSGWDDIAAGRQSPRLVARHLVYPLIVLAALAVFVQMAYRTTLSLSDLLMRAAVVFAAYFVGMLVAQATFPHQISKCTAQGQVSADHAALVVDYTVGLLALGAIITNVLPMTLGLPYILPLAITLIAWKADAYLAITEEGDLAYVGYVFVCIALPPMLIQAFFDWILSL